MCVHKEYSRRLTLEFFYNKQLAIFERVCKYYLCLTKLYFKMFKTFELGLLSIIKYNTIVLYLSFSLIDLFIRSSE